MPKKHLNEILKIVRHQYDLHRQSDSDPNQCVICTEKFPCHTRIDMEYIIVMMALVNFT